MTDPHIPSHEPHISSYYVHWLYDYLRGQGADPERTLGVLPDKAARPFYTNVEWERMLDDAALTLGDPALGLNFGRTFTPERFGVLGYLFHHCETLGQVHERMQQYQRLLLHLRNSRVVRIGELYALGWHFDVARPSSHAEAFTIASALQFARMLTGDNLQMHSVGFMNPAPPAQEVLQQFAGCKLCFDQPMTYLASEQSLLGMANLHSDAGLRRVLEEQANALLAALPSDDAFLQHLRRQVISLLQEGEPTLDRAAQALRMSPRTLHRRLAEHGFRFREVLEMTRRELAEAYLRDVRLSLAEVALLLGYSEQSPFTHAFKRWTGFTPNDWRRHNTGVPPQ